MEISCVHCKTKMQTRYVEGVAVQLCEDCKGVYLTERKLAIIEGRQEPHNRRAPFYKDQPLHCPHCQHQMNKVRHGNSRKNLIDFCHHCSGIWLEKDALRSLQAVYEMAEPGPSCDPRHVA